MSSNAFLQTESDEDGSVEEFAFSEDDDDDDDDVDVDDAVLTTELTLAAFSLFWLAPAGKDAAAIAPADEEYSLDGLVFCLLGALLAKKEEMGLVDMVNTIANTTKHLIYNVSTQEERSSAVKSKSGQPRTRPIFIKK